MRSKCGTFVQITISWFKCICKWVIKITAQRKIARRTFCSIYDISLFQIRVHFKLVWPSARILRKLYVYTSAISQLSNLNTFKKLIIIFTTLVIYLRSTPSGGQCFF